MALTSSQLVLLMIFALAPLVLTLPVIWSRRRSGNGNGRAPSGLPGHAQADRTPAEGMHCLHMPTAWDIYTAPRGGVNGEGMAEWAHIKPFAAVLDRAQEPSQMVVAVTVAMPSTRCRLRVMGKAGGEDEWDTGCWGEEMENAQTAQHMHYYDIGLMRLPWPAVPLCCDSDDSDAG